MSGPRYHGRSQFPPALPRTLTKLSEGLPSLEVPVANCLYGGRGYMHLLADSTERHACALVTAPLTEAQPDDLLEVSRAQEPSRAVLLAVLFDCLSLFLLDRHALVAYH